MMATQARPPYAKAWPCGSVLRTQPAFEGRSSRIAVASSMTPVCDVPTDTSIYHHSVHRHLHGWRMGPLATKRRRLNSGMPACWPDMQVTSAAMPCIDEVWHTDHYYVRPPAAAEPCSCEGHETSLSRSVMAGWIRVQFMVLALGLTASTVIDLVNSI